MKIIDDYVQRRVDEALEEFQNELEFKEESLVSIDAELRKKDEMILAKNLELKEFKIKLIINLYNEGFTIDEIVKVLDEV